MEMVGAQNDRMSAEILSRYGADCIFVDKWITTEDISIRRRLFCARIERIFCLVKEKLRGLENGCIR